MSLFGGARVLVEMRRVLEHQRRWCPDCLVGWTGPAPCWSCGEDGIDGVLPPLTIAVRTAATP